MQPLLHELRRRARRLLPVRGESPRPLAGAGTEGPVARHGREEQAMSRRLVRVCCFTGVLGKLGETTRRTMAVLALSAAALTAAVGAQSSPGAMTPLVFGNGVQFGSAVISTTETPGEVVDNVEFLELRSVGSGFYRLTATVSVVGQSGAKMITGSLILSINPPVWVPGSDLAGLNINGGQGRCSMSQDGLV